MHMDQWTSTFAPIVGRILLGGFFLWSGIQKVLNFDSLVGYFGHAGFPQPLYVALFIVVLETLCGIAVVVDIKTKFFAILLAVYLLITSFLFFRISSVIETQLFLENMGLVGGLLILGGLGSSKWSPGWRK